MAYDAVWTNEWPKEPGLYWFFGHTCCHAQEKGTSQPELVQVVAKLSKGLGLYFIVNAAFFSPKDVGDGQWAEGMVPKLPVNFLENTSE